MKVAEAYIFTLVEEIKSIMAMHVLKEIGRYLVLSNNLRKPADFI